MIMSKDKRPLSTPKAFSKKMMDDLKALALKYSEMFKDEYTVRRVIMTRQGWKTI
jgi:hypothetical protein